MKKNIKYVQERNAELEGEYKQIVLQFRNIAKKLAPPFNEEKKEYFKLLTKLSDFISQLISLEEQINDKFFIEKNFEELLEINHSLYQDILPENYPKSYSNPTYCVEIFGLKMGALLSYFYFYYHQLIHHTYAHKRYKLLEGIKLFNDTFHHISTNTIHYKTLHEVITSVLRRDRTEDYYIRFQETYNPEYRFFTDILNNDLTDLRYLFKTGKYISKNIIKMANFLASYPRKKIRELATFIVDAYLRGFVKEGKSIKDKTTVMLRYNVGFEVIIKELVAELKNRKLFPAVLNIDSKSPNEQAGFDHKFDIALAIDEAYGQNIIDSYKKGIEKSKDIFNSVSGIIAVGGFGEKQFSPEIKKESLKLSDAQKVINQNYNRVCSQIFNSHLKRSDTSFSMIAFPVPDIGDRFEEIFEKVFEINTVDSEELEHIQQKMIDILDQADIVHIKGNKNNRTDLKVKLQKLAKPTKETLFSNCVADVNIPAGEIYTSPQLKGTNGILHVAESYQNALLFKNLSLTFEDGYVTDYNCSNFKSDKENKEYVRQNLLFPHDTLPMGEFAIGTNTLAYVFAQKYKIQDILPILISEKTAPHFAIGDTCYSMSEDVKVINRFNNKRIVACDNEKSRLRKTEQKNEAYTYKHNDVVLPFDSIEFIKAELYNGKSVDIIRNGKFVLKGTEELNKPLIEFENKTAKTGN